MKQIETATTQSPELATMAQQIRVEHKAAQDHADQAIHHAKRAGDLLLKVKAELAHGEFLPWVDANLEVSRRQAQRYMGAAQGKPTSARKLKSDTVSHLPAGTENGANWLPEDESTGLMIELEPYRDWVDGVREYVTPALHVQMCPGDSPHYDVMLLESLQVSYTKKPTAHWGVLAHLAMMAGGRMLKGGGMFPMFDPADARDDPAFFHARMGQLPWEKREGIGFVRSLINDFLALDGEYQWPMKIDGEKYGGTCDGL